MNGNASPPERIVPEPSNGPGVNAIDGDADDLHRPMLARIETA